jgi:hypothetical protein
MGQGDNVVPSALNREYLYFVSLRLGDITVLSGQKSEEIAVLSALDWGILQFFQYDEGGILQFC